MPEYLAPGVYVEEKETGPKPIEGVSTSTAGFVGETERGPVAPQYITSFEQYERVYGGFSWGGSRAFTRHLPYEIHGFFENDGKRCYVARVLGDDAKQAKYPSAPSESPPQRLLQPAPDVSESEADRPASKDKPDIKDSSPKVGSNPDLPFTILAKGPGVWGDRVKVEVRASDAFDDLFDLSVSYWSDEAMEGEPDFREDFPDLSYKPDNSSYYERQVNNASNLIELTANAAVRSWTIPKRDKPKECQLTGGSDGDEIKLVNYEGSTELGARTGLAALEEKDGISILWGPDEKTVPGLPEKLIGQCEKLKDRFAVLQAPEGSRDIDNLRPRDAKDTKYAAYYYPWIWVRNPNTGDRVKVPPGGYIAGVYARNDTERGVHKAPANETLRRAIDLEFKLTRGDQELLNPRGVNCIRAFPGRGIRVWGARTMSSDTLWKYVNIRRLFLYLEESIDEGTQWVVFEPNDHRLWARVRLTVSNFLTDVWRDGALMGRTAEEAFFVACDETTMTESDIENGRLVVKVGVAPVRPAEFVIFKITQWRGGLDVSD